MSTTSQSISPLRIGILGCASIAKQFARDVAPSQQASINAVASRNADRARAIASAQGIDRHHGSYEALLCDSEIDAVYIPLPNTMHAGWTIKAAEAGKHVLCEKPMALSLKDARAMLDAAKRHGVILLEAYPYYFQPHTSALLDLVRKDAIGTVRSIQASFGFTLSDPKGNIRMKPELGGGALLDAGCYPLSLIRLLMGSAPQSVQAVASWSETGVDMSVAATLYYAGGARAQLTCAMDAANHRLAHIVGTQGVITTEYLNHTGSADDPFGYRPNEMRIRRGAGPFEDIRSDESGSGFRFAVEAFAKLIAERDHKAIGQANEASLDNAATLEALAQSAKEMRTVDLGSAP